ncbi:Kef-type K+ transport system, membrane component KefB [Chryseolinea serpens]|uniref:Kef-type K+ transport system, membrane component KefB n=1 Tax=Chryseolinea serpens TaxID=947013 RepID=A0A1M5NPY1_9BACT|nr:cation:proton antiporter [Chryseolinea serpens]SHG91582.1 Kef-type K+ transport system, membrane component KefB [Chryseolinea serpens]
MGKLGHADVVHLLVQLSIMLVMGRLFAEVFRKLNQPAVIGEIIAGILLGPTVLGMLQPEWFEALYPHNAAAGVVLTGFVQVAVIMLLFIAGLEVDLHIVVQQGRQALTTSLFGLIIPFSIGFIFPYFFPTFFGIADANGRLTFALFMGTAMAITALPVIVRILMDLNLFKSKMGLLVVASAMVDDLVGWIIFSVLLGLIGKKTGEHMPLFNTIILTIGFAAFMLTIGRGLLNRLLPWINRKMAWPGGVLSVSLALCFLAGAFTEYIGIHAIFGSFIMGVALGDSEHFSERAKEIVHQFINNIFAPLFFVSIGLRVNFFLNFDLGLTLIILAIAFTGKIVGSGLGTRLGGFSWKESLAAGFGMNARGAMEIILGLIALENGLINEKVFVSLVIMALITSMTSGPLMKWSLARKWER